MSKEINLLGFALAFIAVISLISITEISKWSSIAFLMTKIKVDSVNEEYNGQVVLEIDGNYYEYNYDYMGEFK